MVEVIQKKVSQFAANVSKNNPRWLYTSGTLEPLIQIPIVFALLGMYQGMFSGNAIAIPARLERAFSSPAFRFVSLFLIALQSTGGDMENALIAVLTFLAVVYALKNKEERGRDGFI